jgi:hypothetical protein
VKAILRALRRQLARDLLREEVKRTDDSVTRAEKAYAHWHGLSYPQWCALPVRTRTAKRDAYFRAHRL